MRNWVFLFFLAAGVSLAPPASALSPPPGPEHYLPLFYQAMDGDSWHNNTGWLDPEVDACDWFGVTCASDPEWGYRIVTGLELPKNNLSGALGESGALDFVEHYLDLSDNRISGELELLHWRLRAVDLSGNLLAGPLPEVEPTEVGFGAVPVVNLRRLDLSRNDFGGPVPSSWRDMNVLYLDLSDNRLEGVPEAAFRAMYRGIDSGYLSLADNQFEGALPDWIIGTGLLPHNKGEQGGGLNLCWNDWVFPESGQFHDWLAAHHVGGDNYDDCIFRQERTPIDATVSGSWYDPSRSGEGVVLHYLDRGEPLLYWFTFDDEGGQRWLVEVGAAGENHFRWSRLYETRGDFSRGFSTTHPHPLQERGAFRFDRTGADSAHVERVYYDPSQEIICIAIFPPPSGCFVDSYSDRLEHIRLTRLAGTTCDNRMEQQWMSGVWRSRDASGEGFIVEVMEDGRAVVYWFTYTPDGSGRQAWVTGVGGIDGNIVTAAVVQPLGAGFGGNFNRGDVRRESWGEVTLEFDESRDGGQASWTSNLAEYGSGGYAIERLARPMMAECDL